MDSVCENGAARVQPRNFFGDRVTDKAALRWLVVKWDDRDTLAIEHRRPTKTGRVFRRIGWTGSVCRGEIVSVHHLASEAFAATKGGVA